MSAEATPEQMGQYDPLVLSEKTRKQTVRGLQRRYYRLPRGGRWYGGIATADCCGCNLRCVFCWSRLPRDKPGSVGKFYSPQEVFHHLHRCACKRGYRQLRISGNEPTLHKEHLLSVLELVEKSSYTFILETNGTLIDDEFARQLARFSRLWVRVSLKGASAEEFSLLTGARPEAFDLQLGALAHLLRHRIRCNPAVMLSFSSEKTLTQLTDTLQKISPLLLEEFEEEYVILYPHVKQRLKEANLTPVRAFTPNGVPEEFV